MEGNFECSANFVALSPVSFIERAAFVYGAQDSIVDYGNHVRYSWRDTYERCLKLASALSHHGLSPGDTVAAFAPNIPALYELHFGAPMAGAILSALNTRLVSSILASILLQLEPKIIFVDYQFIETVIESVAILKNKKIESPVLVLIPESNRRSCCLKESILNCVSYDEFLGMGKSDFEIVRPIDERAAISVNYTSGSTGMPKGVVYSHRAAYLNSLAVIFRYDMGRSLVFLWTVDMFRCNGWCFPWAVAAMGGTNVCLREVSAKAIFDAVAVHGVTHLCGQPALLDRIAESPDCDRRTLPHKVEIIVAGALPPPWVRQNVQEMGFNVSHAYGMTEALGPLINTPLKPDVNLINRREGIHGLLMEEITVKDPATMTTVPADGTTIGEVMFRGNTVMSGYLKNLNRTLEVFNGGWYRTGDLGVRHPDGFIEMKDRSIDMIVSGEKSISTLEVEAVLVTHPMVSAAAVVGKPEDLLGETVCAFVKVKDTCRVTPEEIIEFCGERLDGYKVPRSVVLGDLPEGPTGKIQKFVLREKAKTLGVLPRTNGNGHSLRL